MRGGRPGRLLHLFVRRVQAAVADVLAHGAGEEVRILQDHRNLAAQLVPLHILDFHAVDGDGPLFDIVETV